MSKPHPPPRWLLCYGVAIIAVGLALLVRMAIDPYLHDQLPHFTFFVAVAAAAWFGGLGPALLSTALGFLAADCFFIAPRGTFWITTTGDAVGVVSYFVVTLAIALFSHAMHKAREQALLRQHELERQIAVHRQAEREQEIASEFLALVNASTGTRQLVESAAHFFKAQSDCEAVGIRLREGEDDPCYEAHGIGYESVALIALRVGEDRFGLLQLNDRRKNRFTPDMIALWEKLAGYLAVALAKTRAEEALRSSEAKFSKAFAASPDAMVISRAEDGLIRDINESGLRLIARQRHEVVGKRSGDLGIYLDPKDRESSVALLKQQGKLRDHELLFRRPSGEIRQTVLAVEPIEIAGETLLLSVVRDVTEQKQAAMDQDLAAELLRAMNRGVGDLRGLISEVLGLIRNRAGFDAVGLRLRQGEDCPYYQQDGFSDEFLREENFLCAKGADGSIVRDASGGAVLECTCGLVLGGRTDPTMSCFTKGGSFWTNRSTELLNLAPANDPRENPRNRCIHAGYQSVALIPVRAGEQIIGLLQLNARLPDQFTPERIRLFEGIANNLGLALERRQTEDALRQSESRYRRLMQAIPVPLGVVNRNGQSIYFNDRFTQVFGYTQADLPTLDAWWQRAYPEEAYRRRVMENWQAKMHRSEQTRTETGPEELSVTCKDGTVRTVVITNLAIEDCILAAFVDVTERKRAEGALHQLNRTLRALSSSSQALLRATDEKQYVQEVCQIIVKDCGHRMAWVGYALEDEDRTVEPVAWAGVEEGYVRIARITWADTQRGRGPTGTAIRTKEVVVCNDFVSDPRFAPWRSEALKRSYASSISFPLLAEGRAFGALMIYSELPAPFSPDEVALLTELAGNLAHGITSLRLRHARAQAETALRDSEERFRGIVETAEEGIATHQPDGTITYVNQRMADMLGYSREEIIGKSSLDFVEDDEKEAILRARQCLKEQDSFSAERRLCRKDGSALWTLVNVSPRRDDAGNLLGYLAMHTDITARKRAEEELNIARLNAEHARAIAEEANKAKDHFLAVLSHELRTPLNPALMAATILDGNPQLPPDLREDVAVIRRNVELEARLIDDMLDLTRIARGKLTLNRRIVDGREVLRHAIQTCDADAMNKYLALEVTIPDEPLWIDADPARLQQVFWNLLKNAIKFTPEHGRITVTAAASAQGGLHVEVCDTGKGIAPEALTPIFDAFEQGGSNVTRRYGGLGLGLAICKGLVAMHDGSIHAASEGLGKGATFVVELPPAQRQGQTPSQQPATQAGEAASSTDGGCRILLVEDHESTAAMTTRLLRSFGHRVSTADSIKSALARFASEPFDLVISDLGLPDGTGHDLIRQVLAQRPVPAIALSGYGMDADIQQSSKAGFLEHLVKPVNIRQLEAAIARVTQQKGAWEHR